MLLSAIFVGIDTKGLGYAAAVVLYLFQTFFTLGWQSNMWIYPSELLPLKLRLRGGALAVVSQWLFTFLVVEITPPMITNIGYKVCARRANLSHLRKMLVALNSARSLILSLPSSTLSPSQWYTFATPKHLDSPWRPSIYSLQTATAKDRPSSRSSETHVTPNSWPG